MAQEPTKFYQPYDSGDESDSGRSAKSSSTNTSGSGSTNSSDSWFSIGNTQSTPQGPNFSALAQRLQQPMGVSTFAQSAETPYSEFGSSLLLDSLKTTMYGSSKFATEPSKEVTLITIDSTNRDRIAYPQPSFCVFRFPTYYKNVTTIVIPEIKLLTSFYFFNKTKGNTDITITEKERTITIDGVSQPLSIKTYIADGSYSINSLQAELNQENTE